MTGFSAFKFYVAMKQHFTTQRLDIFQSRNKIKGSYEAFLRRDDYKYFESFAKRYSDSDYILYLASNCMYGFYEMIWNEQIGVQNFNIYKSRRDALTETVKGDLECLDNYNARTPENILRMLTGNFITFETVVLLNKPCSIVETLRKSPAKTILEPLLLRIDKADRFVKTNENIENLINNFRKI